MVPRNPSPPDRSFSGFFLVGNIGVDCRTSPSRTGRLGQHPARSGPGGHSMTETMPSTDAGPQYRNIKRGRLGQTET